MTGVCPGALCPMCSGTVCLMCESSAEKISPCVHNASERHSEIVAVPGDVPIQDRTPTQPRAPIVGGRIEVDLADGNAVASFFELVAKIARSKGRLTVIVE